MKALAARHSAAKFMLLSGLLQAVLRLTSLARSRIIPAASTAFKPKLNPPQRSS